MCCRLLQSRRRPFLLTLCVFTFPFWLVQWLVIQLDSDPIIAGLLCSPIGAMTLMWLCLRRRTACATRVGPEEKYRAYADQADGCKVGGTDGDDAGTGATDSIKSDTRRAMEAVFGGNRTVRADENGSAAGGVRDADGADGGADGGAGPKPGGNAGSAQAAPSAAAASLVDGESTTGPSPAAGSTAAPAATSAGIAPLAVGEASTMPPSGPLLPRVSSRPLLQVEHVIGVPAGNGATRGGVGDNSQGRRIAWGEFDQEISFREIATRIESSRELAEEHRPLQPEVLAQSIIREYRRASRRARLEQRRAISRQRTRELLRWLRQRARQLPRWLI